MKRAAHWLFLVAFVGVWSLTTYAAAQPDAADELGMHWLNESVDEFGAWIIDGRTTGRLAALLISALVAAFGAMGMRRARQALGSEGLIPNALAVIHLALRILVLAFALGFVVHALPPRVGVITLLAFAGFAVAVGWSTRDFLPDVVGGFVLVFERRIHRDAWISGDGFSGQVIRVGLRTTLLHDSQGHRVSVPNRRLLTTPVTVDASHEREHEVLVRLTSDESAEKIREALRDAVLSSPWVYPGAEPIVFRDPTDPSQWRVRGRLLEASFGARFEGELLERTEARLGRQPRDLTQRMPDLAAFAESLVMPRSSQTPPSDPESR